VREVFDLSASDNLTAPSLPILLAVLSENEMKEVQMKQQVGYRKDRAKLEICLI
jgi:hypothetical protein